MVTVESSLPPDKGKSNMPSSFLPGRRRAPKAPWHSALRSSVTPQFAVKTVAALGIVGAATASVVVPAAGPAGATSLTGTVATAQTQTATASAAVADARMAAFLGASRDTERTSVVERESSPVGGASGGAGTTGAVTSPAAPAPTVAGAVGITGIEAVAKPAPEVNLDKAPASASAPASATQDSVYAAGGYSPTAHLGFCRGLGLGSNAAGVCSAIRSLFGPMTIGGYRAGDGGDHGAGQAADIMTSNFAQGDAIAAFLQDHASELNIKYIIWKQRYWAPGSSWRMMSDRGSPTQNHFDHVHVSVR